MKRRDIGQELLEAVREIKSGEGRRVTLTPPRDVRAIREHTGLSQSAFAALLGVSVRTLQDWEQGRRIPSGAALSLLRVAEREPEAVQRALVAA
jgi:putative transcriptional regulator